MKKVIGSIFFLMLGLNSFAQTQKRIIGAQGKIPYNYYITINADSTLVGLYNKDFQPKNQSKLTGKIVQGVWTIYLETLAAEKPVIVLKPAGTKGGKNIFEAVITTGQNTETKTYYEQPIKPKN
jgi:hypothetical protein